MEIYKIDIISICTGTRIEAFSCKQHIFLNKKKAIKFAYEKAFDYAKYSGLPVTHYNKNKGLIIEFEDIDKIEEKYINIDTDEDEDENEDEDEDEDEENDNSDNEDNKQRINKGILKIGNYYKWPNYDSSYGWDDYLIHLYKDYINFNAEDGIILKSSFSD